MISGIYSSWLQCMLSHFCLFINAGHKDLTDAAVVTEVPPPSLLWLCNYNRKQLQQPQKWWRGVQVYDVGGTSFLDGWGFTLNLWARSAIWLAKSSIWNYVPSEFQKCLRTLWNSGLRPSQKVKLSHSSCFSGFQVLQVETTHKIFIAPNMLAHQVYLEIRQID